MDDDLAAAEKRARRLVQWAALLATAAIIVLLLDVLIKNAILDSAKESQGWVDALRRDARNWPQADYPGRGNGDSSLAGVDTAPRAPAGTDQDAGRDDS